MLGTFIWKINNPYIKNGGLFIFHKLYIYLYIYTFYKYINHDISHELKITFIEWKALMLKD